MLNKATLESATDIIQNVQDIESHDTVSKDDVSIMTKEDKRSVEILKKPTSKLELNKLIVYCGNRVITSYPITDIQLYSVSKIWK